MAVHGANKYVEHLAGIFGDDVKPYWSYPDEKDKEKIFHASLILNGRTVYIEDDDAGFNVGNHANTDPNVKIAARLSVCVPDAFAVEKLAVENGAIVIIPCAKQFWGGVYGSFRDPNGVIWSLGEPSGDSWAIPDSQKWQLIPELAVREPDQEIEFIQKVFGGVLSGEVHRTPEGKIMHSTLVVNHGGLVFVNSQFEGEPRDGEVSMYVTVPKGEAEPLAAKIAAADGKLIMPVALQFWGNVYGRVADAFGLQWGISEPEETGESAAKKPRTD